jgi:flagellin
MSFRINTNVNALMAYYSLQKQTNKATNAQLRLASGLRINHVSDDTSGFNIGKSLEGRIKVMQAAQTNVTAAKDLMSTAEGSLLGVNDLLISIEGKLSDALNPTADRDAIASDIRALADEIQATLESSRYNNTQLLSGTDAKGGFTFQVGSELKEDRLNFDFASNILSTNAASFNTSLANFQATGEASLTSTQTLDSLADNLATLKAEVTDALGDIGNYMQRLDIKEDTLGISIANAQSSYSRLFDADIAMEQLNATKATIMQQSATAMVAQLNTNPGQVLQLFG